MFKHLSAKDQLLMERQKREALGSEKKELQDRLDAAMEALDFILMGDE